MHGSEIYYDGSTIHHIKERLSERLDLSDWTCAYVEQKEKKMSFVSLLDLYVQVTSCISNDFDMDEDHGTYIDKESRRGKHARKDTLFLLLRTNSMTALNNKMEATITQIKWKPQ